MRKNTTVTVWEGIKVHGSVKETEEPRERHDQAPESPPLAVVTSYGIHRGTGGTHGGTGLILGSYHYIGTLVCLYKVHRMEALEVQRGTPSEKDRPTESNIKR